MIVSSRLVTVYAIFGLSIVAAKADEYQMNINSIVLLSNFETFYNKNEHNKSQRYSCLPKETEISKPNPLITFFSILKVEPDGVDYLLSL